MRQRLRRRCAALMTAGLLALSAGACGSGGDRGDGVASISGRSTGQASAGNSNDKQDPLEAGLAFAKCMREHGVDMPDPKVSANGLLRLDGPRGGNQQAMDKAMSACQDKLQSGGNAPPPNDPKLQEAMLKFARCMREHGVENFPDPGKNGLVLNQKDHSNGIDPSSPTFQAAEKACNPVLGNPQGSVSREGGSS